MGYTSTKIGLRVWDQLGDRYDHQQLADNFNKIDFHDHTIGRGVQIPTEGLADGAVTSAKLDPSVALTVPDNSITTIKFVDGNVTTAKIADLAISTAKLADGSVTSLKLATNAVTTTKILDANVTTSKIADAGVTKVKLATDSLNAFLKLAIAANRKVNFGSSNTGSFGGDKDASGSLAHGLAVVPVAIFLSAGAIAVTGGLGSASAIAMSWDGTVDATNFGWRATIADGVSNNGANFYWLAIG